MQSDRRKIVITVGFALLVLVVYSAWNYVQEEAHLIAEVDEQLFAAAVSVPFVLADDFHERALTAKSIPEAEDLQNIENLSRLNRRLHTKFLYTVIRDREGDYRLSSSSALDEEIARGEEVRYFTPYPDVSNILKKSFEKASTEKSDFRGREEEYKPLYVPIFSDRWGSYRSVFVPIRSENGNLYAVGADIDITNVKALLRKNTIKTILEFLLFLLVLLPIIYVYVATLKRKHLECRDMHQLYVDQSRLSYTDPLTQINNRLKLDEELQLAYAHYQRGKSPFGLVMIDIDHFKKINDKHGHQVGDMVLQRFAALLQQHSRATDTIGRWGGEEFLIIYHNTDLEGAYLFAEKLRQAIEAYMFDEVGYITASFGVAQITPGLSVADLLVEVDTALYAAKKSGRNCTKRALLSN
jgi:diguanylate cyclase (GGDEF)-like protein